jgi:hypothetical protein
MLTAFSDVALLETLIDLHPLSWIVDYGESEDRDRHNERRVSMATAIVRIYTEQGFVVAADGRTSDANGNIRSDSTQKIFYITHPQMVLAYAIGGTVGIIQQDGEVLLDIRSAIHDAMAKASQERRGLDWLSLGVKTSIVENIRNAKKLRRVSPRREAEPTTHLFIDGYYAGEPSRFHIKFCHGPEFRGMTNGIALPNTIIDNYGYGSPIVMAALDKNDERFREFRPMLITESLSLSDATIIAHNRIRSQFGDVAVASNLDPMVCRQIGGNILIATVTPDNGFQWVDGFSPVT